MKLQVLSSRNVELVLGYSVANISRIDESASPGSKRVKLELQPPSRGRRNVGGGKVLEADLLLWTVGTKALIPPAETQSGYQAFPVNGRGQADTDEMLRVKGHPRIFALGDLAGTKDDSGRQLPTTAQVIPLFGLDMLQYAHLSNGFGGWDQGFIDSCHDFDCSVNFVYSIWQSQ